MAGRFALPKGALFYLHRQLLLDAMAKAASHFQGLLLDVGCLDKPFEQYFGSHVTKWIGCDLPSYAGLTTKPDTYGSIDQLPFRDNIFSTVLCTEMFHMVPQPMHTMTELWRVTQPGGHLVLSTVQQAVESVGQPDYHRFTRFGLDNLARRAGFGSTELHVVGGAIAMVLFATYLHVQPLRAHNPLAQTASRWLQRVGVLADRRWRQPRNAIGWVLIARK